MANRALRRFLFRPARDGAGRCPVDNRHETSPTNMTIDRRSFLSASSSALVLGKSGLSLTRSGPKARSPAPPEIERIEAREIAVYTTADKTDYRLSPTGKLAFKPMGQPLETQICVFVDPTKRVSDDPRHRRRAHGCLRRDICQATAGKAAGDSRRLFRSRQRHRLHARAHQHPQLRLLDRQLHLRRRRRQGAEVVQRGARQAISHSVHQAGAGDRRRTADIFASPWSPPAFMKTTTTCCTAES